MQVALPNTEFMGVGMGHQGVLLFISVFEVGPKLKMAPKVPKLQRLESLWTESCGLHMPLLFMSYALIMGTLEIQVGVH